MFADQDYFLNTPFDTSSDVSFLSTDSDYGFFAHSDWSTSPDLPSLDSLPAFSDALTVAKDTSSHAVYPHANNELRLAYLDEYAFGTSSLGVQSAGYSLDGYRDLSCREPVDAIPPRPSSSTRYEMPACIDPALLFTAPPSQPETDWSSSRDASPTPEPLYPSSADCAAIDSPSSPASEPEDAPSTPYLSAPSSSPSSRFSTPSALRTPSCSPAPFLVSKSASDDYEPSPSDEDDDDDDEYVPSHPRVSSSRGKGRATGKSARGSAPSKRAGKKAVRASPYPAVSLSPSSSRDSSSPAPSSASSDLTNDLVVCQRRNRQVVAPTSPPPHTPPTTAAPSPSPSPSSSFTNPTTTNASTTNRWKCPHCEYVQKNRRTPDLRRHVASHTASAAGNVARWVCCGVPLRAAARYGLRAAAADDADGRAFEYAGERMVGGCRKAFSRKDALIRHLANSGGACVGDAWGEWLVGNREKRRA